MNRSLVLNTLAAAALAFASVATAETAITTHMQINANVLAACSVWSSSLEFGDYDPTSGLDAETSAALSITCTNGTAYSVGLMAGNGPAAARSLKAAVGTTSVEYGLFRDPGYTIGWGNIPGVDTVDGVGAGTEEPMTVYARMPAGQFQEPGAYSDTILVVVTY